jgi:tetratricopeptide (TPR) repeat protein
MIGRIFVEVLTGRAFGVPLDATKVEIEKLERLQDDAGLAEAWYLAGALESWLGRSELGGASYERAIEYARRAGNRRLSVLPVGVGMLQQAWGFMPAADGLRECDRLLGEHAGTSIEPPLRTARAMHLSLLGQDEAAARDQALGEELYGQFGNELMRAAAHMSRADKEIRAGRPEAAVVAASAGVELLEALGEQGFLSSTVGQLAEALYRQGRYDEAEEAAQKTADLAMEDDFDPRFRSRAVRARVLAQRGEFEEAEKLAREAVEIVEQTDWYLHHGQALAALGEVLELAGRPNEARAVYEQAVEAFERKGSLPDADAARRRITTLS